MNQNFEFPNILDLKPYSYHHVMKEEGRVDSGSMADKKEGEEEESAKKEEDDEDEEPQPEIFEDDCFEYKLVGVNVHSGTAHAGHYWSYINTKRGLEEVDSENPQWADTEADAWMEYNDSTVKEFATKNIKSECYGDAPASTSTNFNSGMMSGWGGSFGGSYGKSGYMLFYERRVKKPIEIVSDKKEEDVKDDPSYMKKESTGEIIKKVPYAEMVASDASPNAIFRQVFEDNKQFSFENDVYSPEFFNFIREIVENVAAIKDEDYTAEQKPMLT